MFDTRFWQRESAGPTTPAGLGLICFHKWECYHEVVGVLSGGVQSIGTALVYGMCMGIVLRPSMITIVAFLCIMHISRGRRCPLSVDGQAITWTWEGCHRPLDSGTIS